MIRTLINKIKRIFKSDKSSLSLDGHGERVDIYYKRNINIDKLDMYQKSHIYRYQFAQKYVGNEDVCGDFACGTGYGTIMLSEMAKHVIGADLNSEVIHHVRERYIKNHKVEFVAANLLAMNYDSLFHKIISFETIEHFSEEDISKLFTIFSKALKPGGQILFSTPYMQEATEAALKMGFHFTFRIDEAKIENWLKKAGFKSVFFKYQNYQTHTIEDHLENKVFIICLASI